MLAFKDVLSSIAQWNTRWLEVCWISNIHLSRPGSRHSVHFTRVSVVGTWVSRRATQAVCISYSVVGTTCSCQYWVLNLLALMTFIITWLWIITSFDFDDIQLPELCHVYNYHSPGPTCLYYIPPHRPTCMYNKYFTAPSAHPSTI